MVTRDAFKLNSPMARVILRTFKTSLMPINHEMHKQVHTISYTYIHGRRWKLIGHVLRKSVNENMRIALRWTPEGRRRRGRPKETWQTVEREQGELGFKGWAEAGSCAKDR